MEKSRKDTRWMVSVALMAAIVILLANTPLGMIQLPIIKATTVHIPVIIGAVLLGPLAGAILGGVFGVCSMISNTVAPTLLSFAFSPFLAEDLLGVVKSLWIGLRKLRLSPWIALPVTGFVGSLTNTVFVMGSIYVLLASQYAAAKEVARGAVWGLIMTTVTASGIPEAIAAAVLVTALGRVLLVFFRKQMAAAC